MMVHGMTTPVRMNFRTCVKRWQKLNGALQRFFREAKNDVEKLESMKTNAEMFGDAAGILL